MAEGPGVKRIRGAASLEPFSERRRPGHEDAWRLWTHGTRHDNSTLQVEEYLCGLVWDLKSHQIQS